MTAATSTLRADAHVIGLVGVIHALSHFFQLSIAPLFPLMREDLGVSYAELGVMMAVFFTVSGLAQTAAGFIVDRFGPRAILAGGLALYTVGLGILGLAPSYPWMFVGAVFGGLGNSVFHPGDFALLNAKVDERRLGHAFSVHGITGNIGYALGPMFTVPLALATSWRTALLVCAGIACFWALVVALHPILSMPPPRRAHHAAAARAGWRGDVGLLTSSPVVLGFVFFLLYAIVLLAFHGFTTPTLGMLYGMPIATATTALTLMLLGGAAGMLAGGVIATRTSRHALVASWSMLGGAAAALVLATGALSTPLAVAFMGLMGFALGVLGPSRDIIIREIAPAHSRGKVYGFIYSGLDLGGLIAPPLFGWIVDQQRPVWVFLVTAALMLAAIPAIVYARRQGAAG